VLLGCVLLLLGGLHPAVANPIPVEGFARCDSAARQGTYADHRGGQAPSSWEYATDGSQWVHWQSAAVPATSLGDTVVLAFACGLSQQTGQQRLSVNDAEVVTFTTGASEQPVDWQGEGGRLRFEPTWRDLAGDMHGVMYLWLPSPTTRPGEPLRLAVRGLAGGAGAWFMLHHHSDAAAWARDAVVNLASGRRLQLAPPQQLYIGPQELAWDCAVLVGGPAVGAPDSVAVEAELRRAGDGRLATRSVVALVLPWGAPSARLSLWSSATLAAGDYQLLLRLRQQTVDLGSWRGTVAIRHLTSFDTLYHRTEAALLAAEGDSNIAVGVRRSTVPSLLYALGQARRLLDQCASVVDLERQTATAQAQLGAVAADAERVAAGQDPLAGRPGLALRAYRSPLDGRLQPYALLIPASASPATGYPLVVALHGFSSNPLEAVRRTLGQPARPGTLGDDRGFVVVAPYDRDNIGYTEPIGEDDVWRVVEEAEYACRVDTDRVYLTGLSMGGTGALHLGLRHPDRFAAIAAVCGASDWHVWAGSDLPSPVCQRLLDAQNTLAFAENARHLPVALYHGSADSVVRAEHSRRLYERLRGLGYNVTYEEYPGVGHNSWDQAYANGRVLEWFAGFRRPRWPRQVTLATAHPARYGRAYWVTVEDLTEPYTLGRVTAEIIAPDTVRLRTGNIARLRLDLDTALVSGGADITIDADGSLCRVAPVQARHPVTLVRHASGFHVEPEPEPVPLLPVGGLEWVTAAWHVRVYGTGGSQAENEAARLLAHQPLPPSIDLTLPALPDTAFQPEAWRHANLLLIGTPSTNSVLAAIAARLPVAFGQGQVTVAGQVELGGDLLVAFTCPNPHQPGQRLAVLAPTSAAAYGAWPRLPRGLPDYLVARADGTVLREGLWGRQWRAAP
jgi:poly(3-hydroxybutyrate) depolymerase